MCIRDSSKDARGRGGKGGRPRKKPVSDKPETQVSESKNLGFSNGKPVSDKPETQVSESENLGLSLIHISQRGYRVVIECATADELRRVRAVMVDNDIHGYVERM